MLDPNIQQFLDELKVARLKGQLKPSMSDEEKNSFEMEANEKFSLNNWLPDMAKRASLSAISTHPNTFSHSKSTKHYPPNKNDKTSAIVAYAKFACDGFLRTGNSIVKMDMVRNAITNNIASDVYNFLSLTLTDGQSIFEHLEQDSVSIQSQLKVPNCSYQEIKKGLLAIREDENKQKITSDLIKQVYFPVDGNYHLLSLLTPSGLLYKLKQHINDIRFSEPTKQAREDKKKNNFNEKGFNEIYGLTAIGFGGTKPQNISVLNNQNGGVSYLLASLPPELINKKIRRPKTDFFNNSLYPKNYQESFKSIDKLMNLDRNTVHIRKGIDNIIRFIITQVIEHSWTIRQLESGWSEQTQLKNHQKTWLDEAYQQQRTEDDEWLKEVINQMARWFTQSYKKVLGESKAKLLVDTELIKIKALISEQQDGLL